MFEIWKNWTDFIKPKRLEKDAAVSNGSYGKFKLQPLERGFGITLGNSMRRVLLSSIRGAAVTSVYIENVNHEFGTIPGVYEDVTNIILNIKGLHLLMQAKGTKKISIDMKGPGEVRGKDIITDSRIQIVNPDHYIATLTTDAHLKIEMQVSMGQGYVSADDNKTKFVDLPVGTIFLDSFFSPVKRVNYNIENARVGKKTDFDKLILEVWTDGTIIPDDAVAAAAKILQTQFSVFLNFEENEFQDKDTFDEEIEQSEIINENLYKTVDELELSVRSMNCLEKAGIKYIGDLVKKSENEMLKQKNFGRKSLKEIKDTLKVMGLRLGMDSDTFETE